MPGASDRTEQRRSPRIPSGLWIAVDGLDDYCRHRRGNISESGIFFEVESLPGKVGSLHWLYLSPTEKEPPLEVMARVVRVVRLEDLAGQVAAGVAMEFLPETQKAKETLRRMVQRIVALQLRADTVPDGSLAASAPTSPSDQEPSPASPVRRIWIETSLDLQLGEPVHVDFLHKPSGQVIPLRGVVAEVRPLAGETEQRFRRISVRILDESLKGRADQENGPPDTGETIDHLFSALLAPPRDEEFNYPKDHLEGSLERIPLPSLLSFFELNRMSGELRLDRGDRKACFFLREGQLVDVESDGPQTSTRNVLSECIGWRRGTFAWRVGDVDQADQFGASTTALLLDAIRHLDESS